MGIRYVPLGVPFPAGFSELPEPQAETVRKRQTTRPARIHRPHGVGAVDRRAKSLRQSAGTRKNRPQIKGPKGEVPAKAPDALPESGFVVSNSVVVPGDSPVAELVNVESVFARREPLRIEGRLASARQVTTRELDPGVEWTELGRDLNGVDGPFADLGRD